MLGPGYIYVTNEMSQNPIYINKSMLQTHSRSISSGNIRKVNCSLTESLCHDIVYFLFLQTLWLEESTKIL